MTLWRRDSSGATERAVAKYGKAGIAALDLDWTADPHWDDVSAGDPVLIRPTGDRFHAHEPLPEVPMTSYPLS